MAKGKNFSCNNSKGLRKKSDFYETPYCLTELFLDFWKFKSDTILEPACGDGAITKVLKEWNYNVIEGDIRHGQDFLERTDPCVSIMTNPPFSLAFEFIQKAKELSEEFAFLLPLSYLHGKQRYDHVFSDFHEFPLTHVAVFTRYPLLGEPLREDGKTKTGMMVYAWFVWEKGPREHAPKIFWLDNHDYILSKKDT